jgi:hypothetical protein
MSALSRTDWQIVCDMAGAEARSPGCHIQIGSDDLDMVDPTAAKVRRAAKRRGWAVGVQQDSMYGARQKRLDYCPACREWAAGEAVPAR